MIAGEIFVFAPALAGFHEGWLRERMNLAQIAALALEVSLEDETVTQPLEYDLINSGVQRVAIQREGERILLLEAPNAPNDEDLVVYDYMQASGWQRFRWAVDTFFAPPGRVLRVLARPRFQSGEFVESVNPTAAAVDLSNFYVSDTSQYFRLPARGAAGAAGATGFVVNFRLV